MTARQRDNVIYGCIVLGSAAFLAWVIPAFTPPYPGYGVPTDLLPNVAVGIILGLAALALARNLAAGRGKADDAGQAERVHLWHLVKFLAPCLLLMPAMVWGGFIPAGMAFLLAVQWLCGQRKPGALALVSALPVGLMYLAMRYGLGAPMP